MEITKVVNVLEKFLGGGCLIKLPLRKEEDEDSEGLCCEQRDVIMCNTTLPVVLQWGLQPPETVPSGTVVIVQQVFDGFTVKDRFEIIFLLPQMATERKEKLNDNSFSLEDELIRSLKKGGEEVGNLHLQVKIS